MEALEAPDATLAPLTVMRAVAFVSVGFTVMVVVAFGTLAVYAVFVAANAGLKVAALNVRLESDETLDIRVTVIV